MQGKRLFIGSIIQSEGLLKAYPEIQDNFYHVLKGKWTEKENLHLNFKFLGVVDENKVPEIREALSEELKVHESPLKFHGIGAFPNLKDPRVLFMHIFSPDRAALKIAADIDKKLEEIGIEKEKRRFKPHLTLCRVKSILTGFSDVIFDYDKVNFDMVESFEVNLIESELTQKGPIYTILK
jgi:2'-5' RNA ligase